MRINGEPVEKVTSFDRLRSGIVVYDEACSSCGRAWCRAMLGALRETLRGDAYECLPGCKPVDDGHIIGISRRTVEAGRVYAVVDGLEDPADYAAILAVNEGIAKAKAAEREPEKAGGRR